MPRLFATARVLLAAALALIAPPPPAAQPALADRIVAWVNDRPIALSEVEECRMRSAWERGAEPAAPDEEAMLQALDTVIAETLLLAAAETGRLTVETEDVDRRVEDMIRRMETGHGGAPALDRRLASAGLDRAALHLRLREHWRRQLTIARAVAARFTLTSADVDRFVQERRAAGQPAELYRLWHLFFPVSPTAPPARWSQVAERAHLARLESQRRRDFPAVAAEWAQRHADEGAQSGDLGTLSSDRLTTELANAVMHIEEQTCTVPVRTSRGVHLLYLEHKTTPRELLFARRYEEEKERWVAQLRSAATIQVLRPLLPGD